jgi:hypothetical protein
MTAVETAPVWLTEQEAAAVARVSVETLRSWRKRQKKNLPVPVRAHKFGARVLYDQGELHAAIRAA